MIFKLVSFYCIVTYAIAAPASEVPLEKQQPTVIPIVSQSEELDTNGTYKFSYETGNGIKREETAYDKVLPKSSKAESRSANSNEGGEDDSDEIHVQIGSYSYTAPDGTVISVRYIADENGFRPIGNHIHVSTGTGSSPKSGKSLKSIDNSEGESAPVPVNKPVTENAPDNENSKPGGTSTVSKLADADVKTAEKESAPGPSLENRFAETSNDNESSTQLPEAAAANTEPTSQAASEKTTASDITTTSEPEGLSKESSTTSAVSTTTASPTSEETSTNTEQENSSSTESATKASELTTVSEEASTSTSIPGKSTSDETTTIGSTTSDNDTAKSTNEQITTNSESSSSTALESPTTEISTKSA